ncbi:hypothetical protein BYT27DRAFT_7250423 [Phlegmacium glaucopus]|nr:hypothetical protein BYT27DRAFT_7250423 [Phlegmacium glaucopus]
MTARPSLYPHPGPTSSLALRSLRAPLNPLTRQTTSLMSPRSDTPAGPSSSRKDAWGCVHLGCPSRFPRHHITKHGIWVTRSMQDRIAINKIRNRVLFDMARNQLAWVNGAQ